jgi:hypothetical protein
MWPVPHPHPLQPYLSEVEHRFDWAPGLLEIARQAGIEHGVEVGTSIPYIATLDQLVTARPSGKLGLFCFSSKPISSPNQDVSWRVKERLELERRYSDAVAERYIVISSSLLPTRMVGQLEWAIDCSTLDFQPELRSHSQKFADLVSAAPSLPVATAVHDAARRVGLSTQEGWLLFRHCAWHQYIDVDIFSPLLTSLPVRSGGRARRSALRVELFGGDW